MNLVSMLVSLSLSTVGGAPAAAPAPEFSEPRDWTKPPPGAPEDQALWRALDEAHAASITHMARVAQAAYRLRYGRYYEALDEKAKGPSPAEADAARKARARIEAAARAADDAIPKQGLRVRVCKYTLLHLDQRMAFPDDPAFAAELPRYRAEARGCVDELAPFARRLARLADAFEASLADADALLNRSPPAAPAAAKPESGARPPGHGREAPP